MEEAGGARGGVWCFLQRTRGESSGSVTKLPCPLF